MKEKFPQGFKESTVKDVKCMKIFSERIKSASDNLDVTGSPEKKEARWTTILKREVKDIANFDLLGTKFINNLRLDFAFTCEDDTTIRVYHSETNTSSKKYTIQIMALRKSRDVSYFSDLGLVMKYTGEDGIHRYTYGKYDSKNEAERELSQVLQQGYRDAFVISSSRFGKTSVSEGPSAVLSYTQ